LKKGCSAANCTDSLTATLRPVIEGRKNMHRKIRSQISSAISNHGNPPQAACQETKKYILGDVFWVPANLGSPSHSNSSQSPEAPVKAFPTSDEAGSGNLALNPTQKRIRDRCIS
jgi:hypothetical protein